MSAPVYLLHDSASPPMPKAVKVRSTSDVQRAYAKKGHAVWFAPGDRALSVLAKAVTVGKARHSLLAVEKVYVARRVLLDAIFAVVVEPGGANMLPRDELREVLVADNREDLFVAARVVPEDNAVVLFRGDLRPFIVPLSVFKAKKGAPKPNTRDVSLIDHGQTLRLGAFEVASDALLYELDRAFRKRAKLRELNADNSLGACIRRLRLQKGLSRNDFPLLNEKTLARIERGESHPQASTLGKIANRLGVTVAELGSF